LFLQQNFERHASSLSDLSNQGVLQGDKTLLEAKSRCSIGCRAPNLPKFSAKRRSDRKVRQAVSRNVADFLTITVSTPDAGLENV
jgi:hypothetical protein